MSSDVTTWLACASAASIGWVPTGKTAMLPHLRTEKISEQRIVFNVSGRRFETCKNTLNRYPGTLLGSEGKEQYFDPQTKEYFFDRDPDLFRYILNFYRSGKLHFPQGECVNSFEEELSFFGITHESIHECCWDDFTEKKKECEERLAEIEKAEEELKEEEIDTSKLTLRQKLWIWFENPQSALIASVFYYVTGFVIALSVTCTVVETIECEKNIQCGDAHKKIFFILEACSVAVFTVEYTARLYASPNRCLYMRGVLSIIDVVAILPFYVGLFVPKSSISGAFVTLRVFRVFRVFKFSRHSKGLRILGYTLTSCASELGFLLFSLSMAIIIFATVIYYVEKNEPNTHFKSIPSSFWYTIVTMTTLG